MLKCSYVLYLIDFETLFRKDKSVSFIPDNYDIRWCILTERPRLHKWYVWYTCHSRGLHPQQIFTSDDRLKGIEGRENKYQFKVDFIKDVLKKRKQIKYIGTNNIKRVFYVDGDYDCISYMNMRKGNFDFQAITPIDFKTETFDVYL